MPRFLSEPVDLQSLDPDVAMPERGPVGVLLINLGTPDHPTAAAVRRYLGEFLSDPRVVELPAVLWQPILRLLVLTRRPRVVAPKYRQIWLDRGSPLLVHSQDLAEALVSALAVPRAGDPVAFVGDDTGGDTRDDADDVEGGAGGYSGSACIRLAMRYGQPSIPEGLQALLAQGCTRILVAPLYPQYAASTTATAIDAVCAHLARLRRQPTLRFMGSFPEDASYIESLHDTLRAHWADAGVPDRLLLSFHGLPEASVRKGDPYFRECMATARALRRRLGADGQRLHVTFQSRFGAAPWLRPYTLPTLQAWGREGLGTVDVMCPGFLADCLETLEEINLQCREAFVAAGGGQFRYVPCLNAQNHWVRRYAQMLRRELGGWLASA